ncbi:MAG: histidine kinase [Kutzneria sp.]|nr:histidine kinase [Kutzneria sp.]MBV9844716.1 histidine kinase [Kutzneria sp.]
MRDRWWIVRDVALWALLSLFHTALDVTSFDGVRHDWQTSAIGIAGIGVAVGLGRRFPGVALVVVTLALGFPWLRPTVFPPALAVMSYLLGRRAARGWPALACCVTLVLLGSAIHASDRPGPVMILALFLVLYGLVVPWGLGRFRRHHRELLFGGWLRAEWLEREQHVLSERARLRERARIAQDMHDSLGHELSLIALRAGALELSCKLSEHHRRALGELRANAAAAIERLRQVTGVLRADSATTPAVSVQETVSELVERSAASGLAVTLRIEGEPVSLTPMSDLAVRRVVQESLTNAAKHAPGSTVSVLVAHLPDEVVVTVTNGAPKHVGNAFSSGNYGLVGLTERVRLAGGTLTARPHGAGFQVVAHVPRVAAAAESEHCPELDIGSESAEHLRLARRRVRIGLITTILIPVGLVLSLMLFLVTASWMPR